MNLQLLPVLERILEAVLVFDTGARVTDANSVAAEMVALSHEELIGRPLQELTTRLQLEMAERVVSNAELATSRALRGETVSQERCTWRLPGASDGRHEGLFSAYPIRTKQSEIMGTMVVLRDITEITYMQQRLSEEEHYPATKQLVAGVVHDLNGVLNIVGQAAAVLEMPGPHDERKYLALIHKAVREGVEMLQRLRDRARGEAGETTDVDVPALLEEVLELTRPLVEREDGISIKTELKPVDLIHGNVSDLRRVFTNLIINAIQAMPHGGEIQVRTSQQHGCVRVLISDTGIGISPEDRKKIFRPYYTTKATGTGLGLSTARNTVLAHGGSISLSSEVGKGCCFIIELPGLSETRLSRTV